MDQERATSQLQNAIGVIVGTILAISVGIVIVTVFFTTLQKSTLVNPLAPPAPPTTALVALPSQPAWETSAVATGASTDNFTLYWMASGNLRYLRFLVNNGSSFVANNDFIFFDVATVAGRDLPYFAANDPLCRHVPDVKAIFPSGPYGIDVSIQICTDGSAFLGQKSFGFDGPWVEDAVFDNTSLNGLAYIMTTTDTWWRVDYNPGPPLSAAADRLPPNMTKGTSIAQAYATALKTPPPPGTKNFPPWLHP